MKRSNRLVILVGVLLAVLAFVAIVILLNGQKGTPTGEPAEPVNATVLVAAQPIEIGDQVTPDMVETREIPVEAVQAGALLDVSQLGGRTALLALPAQAQITEALFGGAAGTTIDLQAQLQPGEKAIAVQLDPVTGLNFLLSQGDHVDVVVALDFAVEGVEGSPHMTAAGAETVRTVKTVLQNKRVLYVSATNIPPPPTYDEEGNEIPAQPTDVPGSIVVIIAGTDADAELLTFAQRTVNEVGTITMTLRQDTDTAVEETTGVILEDLFETYGLVVPVEVEDLTNPNAAEPGS